MLSWIFNGQGNTVAVSDPNIPLSTTDQNLIKVRQGVLNLWFCSFLRVTGGFTQ